MLSYDLKRRFLILISLFVVNIVCMAILGIVMAICVGLIQDTSRVIIRVDRALSETAPSDINENVDQVKGDVSNAQSGIRDNAQRIESVIHLLEDHLHLEDGSTDE